MTQFSLHAPYKPDGDQPKAIKALTTHLQQGEQNQVLLGVTGSGKTFTMANVIANLQRPALIMAHNKTLAAQLYSEMKAFFPDNAVEYFVSYYDYYQPEAYIPSSDTYIEKDSAINEQIDLMRHSATRHLLTRKDVIVVASVSCIYGLGSPESYMQMVLELDVGMDIEMNELKRRLIELSYTRNDLAFTRGTFRIKGDLVDIFPAHYEDRAWRLSFFGDTLESIKEFDPLTGKTQDTLDRTMVFANSHFVTPRPTLLQARELIKQELEDQLHYFDKLNKAVESQRLSQRTQFDLEMIMESGRCKGIENYSRYLSGRKPGEAPPTLFEYLPKDALLFIDESHVSVPQVGGMYKGDRSRKQNLVHYGFRLPSALDNRPLMFDEWDSMRPQTIFVSATPAALELELSHEKCVEQIIRPTGLVDPVCTIRPATTQVDDLIGECRATTEKGFRTLVTALTKKSAEDLSSYMHDLGFKVTYMHSDIQTLERIDIIQQLRKGEFDVLIGVNLLREGLDIPECALMAILDADKEGFLRNATSLIQTIGRAARNTESKVILYADKQTKSIDKALEETERRRTIQLAHNKKHNITPKTVSKHFTDQFAQEEKPKDQPRFTGNAKEQQKYVGKLKQSMLDAAADLEFEKAAQLRDEIHQFEQHGLLIHTD